LDCVVVWFAVLLGKSFVNRSRVAYEAFVGYVICLTVLEDWRGLVAVVVIVFEMKPAATAALVLKSAVAPAGALTKDPVTTAAVAAIDAFK